MTENNTRPRIIIRILREPNQQQFEFNQTYTTPKSRQIYNTHQTLSARQTQPPRINNPRFVYLFNCEAVLGILSDPQLFV